MLKYRHCDGNLCIKVTDNAVVSSVSQPVGSQTHVLFLSYNLWVFFLLSVFAVQDRSGTGRKKNREAARKADETDGVQGVPQWSNGDGLKDSLVLFLLLSHPSTWT